MSTALTTLTNNLAARFNLDASNSAELIDTLKQTAFKVKDGAVTDAQMTALMIVSQQYGLNPWVKEIYAYPDKGGIVPVVGVDGWSRIINDNPQLNGIEFVYSEKTVQFKGKQAHEWVECLIYRKDREKPVVVREYFDEVSRDLNYANPWNTHPKRMHRHKTLIQCARLAFGFGGIYDQDEAERIVEGTIIDSEHPKIAEKENPSLPPMSKEEVITRYGTDIVDGESGEVIKFSKKSIIQQGDAKAQTLIDFISSKCVLTEDAITEIRSWEKK